MKPILRGTTYHLRKRVPQRYRSVELRETVWISLHTDSERVAKAKAPAAWSEFVEAWEARLVGKDADAEHFFEAARQLAQARGFRYLHVGQVAVLPLGEILNRVE